MAAADVPLDFLRLRHLLLHPQLLHIRGAGAAPGARLLARAARHHRLHLPALLRLLQAHRGHPLRSPFRARLYGVGPRGHRRPQHHLREPDHHAAVLHRVGPQRDLPGLWRPAVREAPHELVREEGARHLVGLLEHLPQHRRLPHPSARRHVRPHVWLAVRHDRPRLHRHRHGRHSVLAHPRLSRGRRPPGRGNSVRRRRCRRAAARRRCRRPQRAPCRKGKRLRQARPHQLARLAPRRRLLLRLLRPPGRLLLVPHLPPRLQASRQCPRSRVPRLRHGARRPPRLPRVRLHLRQNAPRPPRPHHRRMDARCHGLPRRAVVRPHLVPLPHLVHRLPHRLLHLWAPDAHRPRRRGNRRPPRRLLHHRPSRLDRIPRRLRRGLPPHQNRRPPGLALLHRVPHRHVRHRRPPPPPALAHRRPPRGRQGHPGRRGRRGARTRRRGPGPGNRREELRHVRRNRRGHQAGLSTGDPRTGELQVSRGGVPVLRREGLRYRAVAGRLDADDIGAAERRRVGERRTRFVLFVCCGGGMARWEYFCSRSARSHRWVSSNML
mmetsp:Transcript_1707/g.4589  ORF Transcript_1707/g.4589 Transcript_1707/m.4589 type:complete len:551 (+) Transcript_1707:67-1719(+)